MLPDNFVSEYSSTKHFTPREHQILALLVLGCTNPEIAQELGLKEQVVKNYVKMMFDKAGIKNRVCLVADVYDMFLASDGYERFKALQPMFDSWLELRGQMKKRMGVPELAVART